MPGVGGKDKEDGALQDFQKTMSRQDSELKSEELLDILQKVLLHNDESGSAYMLTKTGVSGHGADRW